MIYALWASYISLTTVGYGGDEAQTGCGRGASIFIIFLGITGTSLLISQVQDALHMTPQQQTVMRMIAEKTRHEHIKELSTLAIQRIWRLHRDRKAYMEEQDSLAQGWPQPAITGKLTNSKAKGGRPRIKTIGTGACAAIILLHSSSLPRNHASSFGVHSFSLLGTGRRASIGGIDSQFSRKLLETSLNQNPEVYRSLKDLGRAKKQPVAFHADFATELQMEMKDLVRPCRSLLLLVIFGLSSDKLLVCARNTSCIR